METTHLSESPEQTQAIAAELVTRLPEKAVVALHGDLGAGKTCFVKGMATALGIKEPVTSPTFTLIREYEGSRPLFHADLYRLHGEADSWMIGLEEYTNTAGITAIEWSERATGLLPERTVHVTLEVMDNPDHRRIRIAMPTPS